MRRSYSHHYRRMVPPLLQTLCFRSNNVVHQPVIHALRLLEGSVRFQTALVRQAAVG